MKICCLTKAVVTSARAAWLALLLSGLLTLAQGRASAETGMQVLTRGPVHEAFAETSMTGTTAGIIISKRPYEPIAELPPDQRPDGYNVAWIPGYWGWDDDRGDYIWVSGIWRDVPPGRQWIPGYWADVQGGSQWISGFWGDAALTEITYLPPPPEPLEIGPSSPRTAPNNLWTPGCWVWQGTRYAWQPGYWVEQRSDWIWIGAHYTWTPRGYVYVPGYWDRDISHRGVLFAPVYYEQPVYSRPGYRYSPSIVIDLGVITACLFVQPRSHHYYFGDYYDNRYEERGFYPWYEKQNTQYGVDPLYMHFRALQLQRNPDWDRHIAEQYRYRRAHVEARPAQTLELQINIINNQRDGNARAAIIGRSLTDAIQSKSMRQSFTPINMNEREKIKTQGRAVHKFKSERAHLEKETTPVEKSQGSRKAVQPVRMRLPASPVSARHTGNRKDAPAPPSTPAAPKPRVVEERSRQEKPRKGHPQSESATRQRQSGNTKSDDVRTRPEGTERRPSPANEQHQRMTPESKPSKREKSPAKTESKSNKNQGRNKKRNER